MTQDTKRSIQRDLIDAFLGYSGTPSSMNTDFRKKDAKTDTKDGQSSSDSGGFPYNPFDDFRSVENSF